MVVNGLMYVVVVFRTRTHDRNQSRDILFTHHVFLWLGKIFRFYVKVMYFGYLYEFEKMGQIELLLEQFNMKQNMLLCLYEMKILGLFIRQVAYQIIRIRKRFFTLYHSNPFDKWHISWECFNINALFGEHPVRSSISGHFDSISGTPGGALVAPCTISPTKWGVLTRRHKNDKTKSSSECICPY